VSNPDPRLWAKEGGGDRWPTHETSGRAQGRKESGKRGDGSLGNKKPRRGEPTGRGGVIGIYLPLPARADKTRRRVNSRHRAR